MAESSRMALERAARHGERCPWCIAALQAHGTGSGHSSCREAPAHRLPAQGRLDPRTTCHALVSLNKRDKTACYSQHATSDHQTPRRQQHADLTTVTAPSAAGPYLAAGGYLATGGSGRATSH